MGKCLWKANLSAKDLIAVQTYLREYCQNIYFKFWERKSDYESKEKGMLCKVGVLKMPKNNYRLPELLREAKAWDYSYTEIETVADANIGAITVVKIENGIVKYYFPFVDYARAYMDIRKKR